MSNEKKTYQEEVEAKLDKLNAEIDVLHEKEEELSAEAKVEYGEQLEELEARRDQAQQRLQALQEAGDKAWQDLRGGVDEALQSLRAGVNKARERFEGQLG